jgi:hypothetical protein
MNIDASFEKHIGDIYFFSRVIIGSLIIRHVLVPDEVDRLNCSTAASFCFNFCAQFKFYLTK